MEHNDILGLWMQLTKVEEESKEAPKAATDDDILYQLQLMIRFIRAARTKKMLVFTESKAELTEVFKGILTGLQEG